MDDREGTRRPPHASAIHEPQPAADGAALDPGRSDSRRRRRGPGIGRTLGPVPALLLTASLCRGIASDASAGSPEAPPAATPGEASDAEASGEPESRPLFTSREDGWLDVSGFLDEKYGFLPIVIPITEPAVGYGAMGGLAFIDKSLGAAEEGLGRPNITAVGGLGTENGTWGVAAGDVRHWLDDRVQTIAGAIYASTNLDFYGIGDGPLGANPLRYNLQPTGGMLQAKYRFGDTRLWAGLAYAYATTDVTFEAPAGTPGIPDHERESDVGGFTPSLSFDSRDSIFTPTRGTYLEASAGIFSEALGGDDEFQRVRLLAMQFLPLAPRWYLGIRGDAAASFGDEPFYLRPFISLRGAPIMRYQGEEIAQAEAELRWQFWNRFSVVGFVGCGVAWTGFERLDGTQSVVTGGTGFRYEIAREHGIHMGIDVGFGPDTTAIYVQVGSAWARP